MSELIEEVGRLFKGTSLYVESAGSSFYDDKQERVNCNNNQEAIPFPDNVVQVNELSQVIQTSSLYCSDGHATFPSDIQEGVSGFSLLSTDKNEQECDAENNGVVKIPRLPKEQSKGDVSVKSRYNKKKLGKVTRKCITDLEKQLNDLVVANEALQIKLSSLQDENCSLNEHIANLSSLLSHLLEATDKSTPSLDISSSFPVDMQQH